jgi:hypothetical protein
MDLSAKKTRLSSCASPARCTPEVPTVVQPCQDSKAAHGADDKPASLMDLHHVDASQQDQVLMCCQRSANLCVRTAALLEACL